MFVVSDFFDMCFSLDSVDVDGDVDVEGSICFTTC